MVYLSVRLLAVLYAVYVAQSTDEVAAVDGAIDTSGIDNPSSENDKRGFRPDLGKRGQLNSWTPSDNVGLLEWLAMLADQQQRARRRFRGDLGKRRSSFRGDLGKRRFRGDLGKRADIEDDASDEELLSQVAAAAAAEKRRSSFRGDLGKRRSSFRGDLGKRVPPSEHDLLNESSMMLSDGGIEDETGRPDDDIRSYVSKRRSSFRGDLGKRLSFYRGDLGKRPASLRGDLEK